MNTRFLLLPVLLTLAGTVSAQTPPAAERQALARELNHLLRDPRKPAQEVTLELSGCHVQHTIRDTDADVRMSRPVSVSVSKGNSDWAVNLDNGRFEMTMGFDWDDVTALSYAPAPDDDTHRSYELRIRRRAKNSSTTTSMTLYTPSEAVVKRVVERLEKLRQNCR